MSSAIIEYSVKFAETISIVLTIAPPLIVEDAHLDRYMKAIAQVIELMHTSTKFWFEALQLAAPVMTTI